MGEQVLAAARQLVDAASFEPRAEAPRKTGAQVRTVQSDALEPRRLQGRQQLAACGFDFRKFRQSMEHTGNKAPFELIGVFTPILAGGSRCRPRHAARAHRLSTSG